MQKDTGSRDGGQRCHFHRQRERRREGERETERGRARGRERERERERERNRTRKSEREKVGGWLEEIKTHRMMDKDVPIVDGESE